MVGGSPRKAKPPVIRSPKESEIQQAIKDALILAGFTVRHTSAFRQKGPSGVDKGVPDLLVFHESLPGLYIGMEVKTADGKLSKEQAEAIVNGEYSIVRKPSEALECALYRINKFANRDKDGLIGMPRYKWERIESMVKQYRSTGQ